GVIPSPAGCVVEIERSSGAERRGGFDSCVLASSAIGNVQILASSLRRDLRTTVTDHFCVGAFVRAPPRPSLAPFRHPMLWSGFSRIPELGMNVFVLERPPLANGDRIIQLQSVVEQRGGRGSFSELAVDVRREGVRSHIRANVSDADRALLDAA